MPTLTPDDRCKRADFLIGRIDFCTASNRQLDADIVCLLVDGRCEPEGHDGAVVDERGRHHVAPDYTSCQGRRDQAIRFLRFLSIGSKLGGRPAPPFPLPV